MTEERRLAMEDADVWGLAFTLMRDYPQVTEDRALDTPIVAAYRMLDHRFPARRADPDSLAAEIEASWRI